MGNFGEIIKAITISKIDEICNLIPALNNEFNWERGVFKKTKNDVRYVFKNGSTIDILAARESSRGQRRTCLLMEECVLIDGNMLNSVIIPTTNIDRLLPNNTRDTKEVVNKSQIYITTAGWKNSFAYDKLIELLIQSVIDPKDCMVMGGTYETPVAEGLLDVNFVDQLKLQGTFNDESFDREYRSIWSGDAINAFYSSEKFDKQRVLAYPEKECSKRGNTQNHYYILGVDVGRVGCTTEVCVFKVVPQIQGNAIKSLVNIYTYESEDFESQAIKLKKLYYAYRARSLAIDANGLGIGLIDFMTKSQVDPETNDVLPPFGVEGGTTEDIKDQYKDLKKTLGLEENAMFLIKANAPFNTEAYSYAQSQMSSGRVKFLVDEMTAKAALMETKVGQAMTTDQRNEYLKPYVLTTVLKAQMLNLTEKTEGINIILKQVSLKIKKDKFSAFIYGLYRVKQEEELNKKRRRRSITDYLMFT